jgi:hypothetical protein
VQVGAAPLALLIAAHSVPFGGQSGRKRTGALTRRLPERVCQHYPIDMYYRIIVQHMNAYHMSLKKWPERQLATATAFCGGGELP